MIRLAASLSAISHASIAIVGGIVIAPTSSAFVSRTERYTSIADKGLEWQLAWFVPQIAAICLIWFFIEMRRMYCQKPNFSAWDIAVVLTVLGAAIEGVSCTIGAVLPYFASEFSIGQFFVADKLVALGISLFGNVPFAVAHFIAARELSRAGVAKAIVISAYFVGISGILFAVSGLQQTALIFDATNSLLLVAVTVFGSIFAFLLHD